MDQLSAWLAWCHPGYSLNDATTWIELTTLGRENRSLFDFAVFDGDGTYAGACGLNWIDVDHRVANLGYWIRTSRTRRGVAPAAVRQVYQWAFANTPINRIEILAAVGNVASQRVAEKSGARRDGVLQKRLMVRGAPVDAVLFSIIRPD